MMVNFIVVNALSLYTTILAQQWIHAMGAILSTLHMKVKFLTKQGIMAMKGNQKVAQ